MKTGKAILIPNSFWNLGGFSSEPQETKPLATALKYSECTVLCFSLQALMSQYDANYLADMNFLGKHVWSRVKDVAYCHDSFSCQRFPGSHAFPVKRQGAEHIGAVYDQVSIVTQADIDILNKAPVNRDCVPPG